MKVSLKIEQRNISTAILWVALSIQSIAYADYAAFEKMAIKKVKATPTSEIEEGRPMLPFEVWFQRLAGKKAEMEWGLNDCGEGGDRDSPTPLCVGVTAKVSDGRELTVEISVADSSEINNTQITGGVGVRNIYVGYKGESFAYGSELIKLEEFMKIDARSIGLYYAAAKGDVQAAQFLLKQGANFHSGYGQKAIFVAAENGHLPFVKLLLDAGVDVNARVDDETVLSVAAKWNGKYFPDKKEPNASGYVVGWDSYFDIVQLILSKGVDSYSKNRALLGASRRNFSSRQLDIIHLLLKAGADVRQKDSPLISAAGEKNIEVMRVLLKAGADVNATSTYETALTNCVKNGTEEGLLLLIKHGANVRPNNNVNHIDPPVLIAVGTGSTKKIRILLVNGADMNAVARSNGFTPLMEAAEFGKLNAAKMLVAVGADLNRRNRFGDTALSLATKQNHLEIAKLLRDAGVKR